MACRFNQPVRTDDLLRHLTLHYGPHDWKRPSLSPEAEARLRATDPAGLQAFRTSWRPPTRLRPPPRLSVCHRTTNWDTKRLGVAAPTLVVLEMKDVPPPESWILVEVPAGMPGVQGRVPTPRVQTYTMEMEPTLFVDGPGCTAECDPDRWNPLRLRRDAVTSKVRDALSLIDVTNTTPRPVAKKSGPAPEGQSDRGTHFTLEDLGYDRQKPASTYAYRLDPSFQSIDGQTLGYPWTAVIENWHERAFTSFGDGHGVWESAGGTVLPFYARNFTNLRQWIAPVAPGDLMPTILSLQANDFSSAPPTDACEPHA